MTHGGFDGYTGMPGFGDGIVGRVGSYVRTDSFLKTFGARVVERDDDLVDAGGLRSVVGLMIGYLYDNDLVDEVDSRLRFLFDAVSGDVRDTGIPTLRMPGFVPISDVLCVTVCAMALAIGKFTGSPFAALLHRAELRCDLAGSLENSGLDWRIKAETYAGAVSCLEKKLGYTSDYMYDVAQLVMVIVTMQGDKKLATMATIPDGLFAPMDAAVIANNLVVTRSIASPRAGGSVKISRAHYAASPVVPLPVYSSLVGVGTEVVGNTVHVTVRRRADGVNIVSHAFDRANAYDVCSLPAGLYELPGAFGMLVSASLMMDVLKTVVALPALTFTEGFCYLACIPPLLRWEAATVLGRRPRVADISAMFAEVYDWSVVTATVEAVSRVGDVRIWHVKSGGCLPHTLSLNDRLGSGRGVSELSEVAASILDSIVDKTKGAGGLRPAGVLHTRRGVSPVRDVPARFADTADRRGEFSVGGGARQVHDRVAMKDNAAVIGTMSTRVVEGGLAVPMHTRTVSAPVISNRVVVQAQQLPVYKPVWQVYDQPLVRMWSARLGEGAPLGVKALLELSRCKDMPDTPGTEPHGSVVFMVHEGAVIASSSKMAPWSRKEFSVPGWNFELFKVSQGSSKSRRVIISHPCSGVFCRYEFSFRDSVVLNDSDSIPGTGCSVWASGDFTITVSGAGEVGRAWSDDGSPAVGPLACSVAGLFGAPVIKAFGAAVRADRVIGLLSKSEDPSAGLVRYSKAFWMSQNAERFHFYMFDEVSSEPGCVTVSTPGLRYVVVHGVRRVAVNSCVRFITLDTQPSVQVVTNGGGGKVQVNVEMVFTREVSRFSRFARERGLSYPEASRGARLLGNG